MLKLLKQYKINNKPKYYLFTLTIIFYSIFSNTSWNLEMDESQNESRSGLIAVSFLKIRIYLKVPIKYHIVKFFWNSRRIIRHVIIYFVDENDHTGNALTAELHLITITSDTERLHWSPFDLSPIFNVCKFM